MNRRGTFIFAALSVVAATVFALLLTAAGTTASAPTASRTVAKKAKTVKASYVITGIILKTGGEGAYPVCLPTSSFTVGTPGVVEMNVWYKGKQIKGTKGLKSFSINLDEASGPPLHIVGGWDSSSKLWRICWQIPKTQAAGSMGYTVVIQGSHGTTKVAVTNPVNYVTVGLTAPTSTPAA